MATQAPATTQQGPPAAQSEISEDINWWVQKLSHSAANSQAITNAPGDAPWSSGFFECFNPIDSCLLTCFCPCVTFGKTHHRLNKDADLKGWSIVNGSCIGWYLSSCFGLHCVGTLLQRHDIRQRANPKLGGDFVTDFLKAWCCGCCDLIQQEKEAQALLAKEKSYVMEQPHKSEGMNYGNGNGQPY